MNQDTKEPEDTNSPRFKIVGAAITVLNTIGPGFAPEAYVNALLIELTKQGYTPKHQPSIDIVYENTRIARSTVDLLVELEDGSKYPVLVYSTPEIPDCAMAYSLLKLLGSRNGIQLNFGKSKLWWKALVRDQS